MYAGARCSRDCWFLSRAMRRRIRCAGRRIAARHRRPAQMTGGRQQASKTRIVARAVCGTSTREVIARTRPGSPAHQTGPPRTDSFPAAGQSLHARTWCCPRADAEHFVSTPPRFDPQGETRPALAMMLCPSACQPALSSMMAKAFCTGPWPKATILAMLLDCNRQQSSPAPGGRGWCHHRMPVTPSRGFPATRPPVSECLETTRLATT